MIKSEFLMEKVSTPSNSLKFGMNNPSDPIFRQNPEAPTWSLIFANMYFHLRSEMKCSTKEAIS